MKGGLLLPRYAVPKVFIYLVGPLIRSDLTWEFIKANVGYPIKVDCTKVKNELKFEFMPVR